MTTEERRDRDPDGAAVAADGQVLTGIVAFITSYAKTLGMTLDEIAEEVGLNRFQLLDHEARLSDEIPMRLWNMIRARVGDGALSLHLARATPTSVLGPSVYAMRHAPTLRDALDVMVRFRALTADRLTIELVEEGDQARFASWHPLDGREGGLMQELGIAMMFRFIDEQLGHRGAILGVDLPRTEPERTDDYAAFFGVPVVFGRECGALIFDRGELSAEIEHKDETLFDVARRYLLELEARHRLPRPGDPLNAVRRAVEQCVEEGRVQVEDVASALHVSSRSLQRLVGGHGKTVRGLIDEARAARACELLLDVELDTGFVARSLGYSDERAFRRAFRRWSGVSPQQFRKGEGDLTFLCR